MTMYLPPLYHWSPASKRPGITKRGLRPTTPTVALERPGEDVRPPGHYNEEHEGWWELKAICLSTSPYGAWLLSGHLDTREEDEWDLWQVSTERGDEVHFRPTDSDDLFEVRVANQIPKRRVWYVASRVILEHERRRK